MRAIVCTKWGSPDVLEPREVEDPIPKDNEVLVRIHATTVTAGDCELRGLKFPLAMQLLMRIGFGLRGPRRKILGQELSGEVDSAGRDVKLFRQGDQVFAHCGLRMSAYAEYTCLPEEPKGLEGLLAKKPANLTYEEAAAVPTGGLEALHHLRRGKIQNGRKVLINGSGGSIGTIAVQLAKHFRAEVTAVDSRQKLDMLRSIGADHVIDYTQEDFTKNGETYDVILDVVGRSPSSGGMDSIGQDGRYPLANPAFSQMIRGQRTPKQNGKQVIAGNTTYSIEDLVFLKELIEAGKIRPVIDRSYPLEQTAEAHRYVETGQKTGNVIITVGTPDA